MEEKKSEGYKGFIEGYTNKTIEGSLDVLAYHVLEIKKGCISLDLNPSEYKNLEVKSIEDLGKLDALGHSLIKKIKFNQIDPNEDAKQIAYSYAKMAEIINYKSLKKTAIDLGELVLDRK